MKNGSNVARRTVQLKNKGAEDKKVEAGKLLAKDVRAIVEPII